MKNNINLIKSIKDLKEQIALNELSDDGYYLTKKCKDDYKKLNHLEKILHNKL